MKNKNQDVTWDSSCLEKNYLWSSVFLTLLMMCFITFYHLYHHHHLLLLGVGVWVGVASWHLKEAFVERHIVHDSVRLSFVAHPRLARELDSFVCVSRRSGCVADIAPDPWSLLLGPGNVTRLGRTEDIQPPYRHGLIIQKTIQRS